MSDVNAMVERAAKAMWDQVMLADENPRPWEWEPEHPAHDATRRDVRAILLAALDPEDEALTRFVAAAIEMEAEENIDYLRAAVRVLVALRSAASQGEPGLSSAERKVGE